MPSAIPKICDIPGVNRSRMNRASSGLIRDPPTWTNRNDVGNTGSHSHACAHSFASALTRPVTVI